MEFIKVGDNYVIKDSNNVIVNEEEKLKIEKKELVLKDVNSSNCQEKTTKKIKEINKKLDGINANNIIKEAVSITEWYNI